MRPSSRCRVATCAAHHAASDGSVHGERGFGACIVMRGACMRGLGARRPGLRSRRSRVRSRTRMVRTRTKKIDVRRKTLRAPRKTFGARKGGVGRRDACASTRAAPGWSRERSGCTTARRSSTREASCIDRASPRLNSSKSRLARTKGFRWRSKVFVGASKLRHARMYLSGATPRPTRARSDDCRARSARRLACLDVDPCAGASSCSERPSAACVRAPFRLRAGAAAVHRPSPGMGRGRPRLVSKGSADPAGSHPVVRHGVLVQ